MPREHTHEIVILDRKPDDQTIRRMVHEYFESEAASYDRFNEATLTRQRFMDRIDSLIARDLQPRGSIDGLLSIACGTGLREAGIRSRSGHPFSVVGVDSSVTMCVAARRAGVEAIESAWLDADLGDRQFDAAIYLYSLGLVPSRETRFAELEKIARHLKRGAPFYVDVLNLKDRNEWGPELERLFVDQNLASRGYDLGDTFYRRIGAQKLAYFHYFDRHEADKLLTRAGFRVAAHHYIDCGKNVGDLVGPDEGAILFVTERA
jgi:ubiquinone/menaquinone biosynthesis C-methylase UbiE